MKPFVNSPRNTTVETIVEVLVKLHHLVGNHQSLDFPTELSIICLWIYSIRHKRALSMIYRFTALFVSYNYTYSNSVRPKK